MARATLEEKFIAEFLIDRDPIAAALRAGVARVTVKSQTRKWLRDPSVIARIDAETMKLKAEDMIKPQWVIAKFQEVASSRFSSPSAKTSALRELASIAKMYPEKGKGEQDDTPRGVVLVPADASLENWEKAALKQQKALKSDVR
jgi:hypothetical protein